jgi:release factor glutamine methyltransferase
MNSGNRTFNNIGLLRDSMVLELIETYGQREAGNMVESLFFYLAGVGKTDFITEPSRQLPEDIVRKLTSALNELKKEKPLQYVTGKVEFLDLELEVDERVLIPRPETEELVSWVIEENEDRTMLNLLDIGTGSGCIALSLKKFLAGSTVHATDISTGALEVAESNAARYSLEISFYAADIRSDRNSLPDIEFDIIVSNPPYVTEGEKIHMRKNVKGFEPAAALFVPDNDPLIYYRAIADFAGRKLKEGGIVYVEINERFGEQCANLFRNNGFKGVLKKQDLNGKDRMIKAMK